MRIHRTRCSSLETALWPACWAKGAALLGHENLNTTRIYTTPSVHDLTEAVERLEGQ